VSTININFDKYAKIFKAVSDPKRLRILTLLSKGELCACKILEKFHITQPTLSHDMKILCDTQLVFSRKEGKWSYYSLNKERLGEIVMMLKTISETEQEFNINKCCK